MNPENNLTPSSNYDELKELFLDYNMNSNNIIQITMGRPIVTRVNRPDGLTRQFILNMEYSFKF